jgi:ABC-type branched-subunit amino acid transport system permease subunit
MTGARFLGVLLIAVGALMAGLCGLCTLAIVGSTLLQSNGQAESLAYLPIVLLLGGAPTVFGLLAIWAGVVLVRVKRAPPAEVDPKTFD